ncbi:WD40-containing domain protein [Mycena sanguinolenta]|uniref:WD40-containing domain protein n=1 Tax=Mycena sanguinolenta TaxID=230812 RepID=A0A8H6ZBI4_9AGAR|nr:WD40-containing domain protein [Mycena sanguinolenta]
MADLYSRLLFAAGHGYPLSKPQPYDNFPRPQGVEIGDVGTVADDGTFIVFFNIRKKSDPANRPNWGLPKGYEEVPLNPEDYILRSKHFGPGSHVSNSKLRKGQWDLKVDVDSNAQVMLIPAGAGSVVDVSSSAERTAMLLLQEGASRIDLLASEKFREQAKKHAEDWYAYVRKIGYPVDNGYLYLVTGVDKSTSWNVAATVKHIGKDEISLKLKAVQIGSLEGLYRWEWENGGRFSDSGPRPASKVQNQTVFLRGFIISQSHRYLQKEKKTEVISISESKPSNMFKGKKFLRTIFSRSPGVTQNDFGQDTNPDTNAGAKDNEDTGARDNEDPDVSVFSVPTSYERYHPADAINTHMLAFSPDVSVAITHDDEWISVLEEDEKVPDDDELIHRILLKYYIKVESGCAYLKPLVMDPLTEFHHPDLPLASDFQETRFPPHERFTSSSPKSSMMNWHRPTDSGGKGGAGGIGGRPRVSREDIDRFSTIHSGTGGFGGKGSDGGAGPAPSLSISTEMLLDVDLASVPDMTIDDFCKEYGLRDTSRDLLNKEGFDTVGGILEVSSEDLKAIGLKSGEIAQLRGALRKFLAKVKSQ